MYTDYRITGDVGAIYRISSVNDLLQLV